MIPADVLTSRISSCGVWHRWWLITVQCSSIRPMTSSGRRRGAASGRSSPNAASILAPSSRLIRLWRRPPRSRHRWCCSPARLGISCSSDGWSEVPRSPHWSATSLRDARTMTLSLVFSPAQKASGVGDPSCWSRSSAACSGPPSCAPLPMSVVSGGVELRPDVPYDPPGNCVFVPTLGFGNVLTVPPDLDGKTRLQAAGGPARPCGGARGVRCRIVVEPAGEAVARGGVERFGHPAPQCDWRRRCCGSPCHRSAPRWRPPAVLRTWRAWKRRSLVCGTSSGDVHRMRRGCSPSSRSAGRWTRPGDGLRHCPTRWPPCSSATRHCAARRSGLRPFCTSTRRQAQFGCAVLLSILRADPDLLESARSAIARAAGPERDLLDRAEFGLWINLGRTLAKAIRRIKGQPELRPRLGEAAGPATELMERLAGKRIWEVLDQARRVRNTRAHSGADCPG